MTRFGVVLHPSYVRWAADESVSETVIAAVLLLHERSVDEMVPQLTAYSTATPCPQAAVAMEGTDKPRALTTKWWPVQVTGILCDRAPN